MTWRAVVQIRSSPVCAQAYVWTTQHARRLENSVIRYAPLPGAALRPVTSSVIMTSRTQLAPVTKNRYTYLLATCSEAHGLKFMPPKVKGLGTCYSAAYIIDSKFEQQRFTILEVAADCHELMISWRIMRPSIVRDGEQLDPRCSTQTCHRPNQRNRPSPRTGP